MKKLLMVWIIIFLFLTSIFGIIFSIKYKKQIDILNSQIQLLNSKISELNFNNNLEKHPIEVKVEECIKKDYSTAGMANCVSNSITDWEKEINKNILKLKKIMTVEQYNLLRQSQKEWEKYKQTQWILNRDTIGTMQGTIYIDILIGEQADIVEQRAKELQSLYGIYSEK